MDALATGGDPRHVEAGELVRAEAERVAQHWPSVAVG
jgi:hypothetical protein